MLSRPRRFTAVTLAACATLVALGTGACAGGAGSRGPDRVPPPGRPPAPWSAAPLGLTSVPAEFGEAWSRAANRTSCALVAPRSIGNEAASPRVATFSGGWAVAYDQPNVRSAFGVAGTGSAAADTAGRYTGWPYSREWADGSHAEYGPEGGTGPNQLAYLTIAGQGCLYNVWSRLGRAHLEELLANLRFVR